ncbi:effector-associated domain 2-containing protein [Streptomyces sp. MAR4 CNX-425]|uniref:effector-associated domain 2-containing protein n=1 Tax=Streptomyces sp. MAR4 CNX-425 TaxID=3406343 RepID=UPI003B501B61
MARVAEVLVGSPAGTDGRPGAGGRRGSGYRVGDRFVLTAGHLVASPVGSLRVRFHADRPGEWTTGAAVRLCSEAADLALLELAAPRGTAVYPPRYAAVPDADVVLPFTAVGFPLFKLREDGGGSPGRYRDTFHASGTVAALSNRREGTLELAVQQPAEPVGSDRSPWQGMSGAAVWSDDAVVGVVAAHHRADGPGRLAATRVERWYEVLSPADLDVLRGCAGLPPREELAGGGGRAAVASLVGLPPGLAMGDLKDLVAALAELPTLRRPGGLETVLDDVDPRIDGNRVRATTLRAELYGVLRACLRYPGTLDEFLAALRVWEEGSAEMARVSAEAAALARRHR